MWKPLSPVLKAGFGPYRALFGAAVGFSCLINLLGLALPLYTAQLYDRVLISGSGATLAVLTFAAVTAIALASFLEDVRARLFVALGQGFDSRLSSVILERQVEAATGSAHARDSLLRELDQVRHTATGTGALSLLDVPWAPLLILFCFFIHPAFGTLVLSGALALLGLAYLNQKLVNEALLRSDDAAEASYTLTDSLLRHGETVRAMGMLPDLMRPWRQLRMELMGQQSIASLRNGALAAVIKFMRYGLQLAIFGLGAWLVVERQISAGALFAASILSMRALTPIDQLVGAWRSIALAGRSLQRIETLIATPVAEAPLRLPAPMGQISVESVFYTPPGREQAVLRDVRFEIDAGDALGIVGPSGAGKSTLARLMIGALKPSSGTVRLDGADVFQWDRADFGLHTGYVSQTLEFFAGSIRDNICRFREPNPALIVRAAQMAGIHEFILRLPNGYETQIDAIGAPLSGGQRQRLALARAVYGAPKLIVLDEPNSSLDAAGEFALKTLIEQLKAQKTTVVLIAHRPSALIAMDKIAVLQDGVLSDFGPLQHILPKIAPGFVVQPPAAPAAITPKGAVQ